MNQMAKIEDSGLSPSFSCYTSDSLASKAISKVFREAEGEEFEFSLTSSEEEISFNEIDSQGWTIFSRDIPLKDHKVDRDSKSKPKLFFDEQESSSSFSCSSSDEDELENLPSGTFCVWRPKANGKSSPKCKKSSSTGGSGSKKWIGIQYLLRRSNSEGKDPMSLLTPKPKRISGEASRLKGKKPVHEQFYVQRREENEIVKRKTYLPYRQDLVGLFASSKGFAKMLPF